MVGMETRTDATVGERPALIKLVLSDMDNTLIPVGNSHVSARTLVAIAALQAEGIEFGPATGRGPVELAPFFLGDSRYFSTGILYNGKKIYVDGDLVSASYFKMDDLLKLQAIAQEYPQTVVFYYPDQTDASNPAYYLGLSDERAAEYGVRYRLRPVCVREIPDEPYIGVVVATDGGPEVVEQIRSRIATEIPGLDLVQTFPGWCDILPHGVNKASGLHVLERELGVSSDEVVVFGDAENDLALFDEVENAVAVANATPAAKAAARWHVGACKDDGVALAMTQLAMAHRTGTLPDFMR